MQRKFFVMALVCALALPLTAQMRPPDKVTQVIVNRVKPGMQAQYETGRKKHMAWHKGQNDSWTWEVYEILTGDGTGNYVVVTPNHAWKDFDGRDKFEAADTVDANANVMPSLAGETMHYYVYRADLSRPGAQSGPAALTSVVSTRVKPEGVAGYEDSVKKIVDAANKTNWEGHWAVYQLANGGEGPEFVLLISHANWADFEGPGKTVSAVLQEAFGKEQGDAVLVNLRKSYRSTYSEVLRYRSDLSYTPAK